MNSFKINRSALLLAVAALCGTTAMAGTSTLNVTAAIATSCKFTAVNPLAFTLDPSVVSPGTASTTVTYKCTKGTSSGAFSVGGVAVGGTGYTSGTTAVTGALVGAVGTDLLQYSIGWTDPTALTGDGFGTGSTGKTVTLNGTMAYAQFSNATATTYSGTVALQVLP